MGGVVDAPARPGVARLLLLHPKARILLPGSNVPLEIIGRDGKVLRLLALSAGHCFSSESLATVLNYSTAKSVAPMIKQLRSRLGGPAWGDHAIRSQFGAGYQLDQAMVEVDAFEYRQIVEPLVREYMDASEPEDLPTDRAERDLASLERAASLWRANPAIELEDVAAGEHQYHYEYDRLYGHAQQLRILLAMRVGSMQRLRESILMLENRVNDRHSPDSDDWCLLIRAYYSTGNPSKAKETYARARRYYDVRHSQSIPRRIEDCFRRSQRNDESFSLLRSAQRVTAPDRPPAAYPSGQPAGQHHAHSADLLQLTGMLGLSTHSELSLPGSRMEPMQLMRRVKQRLWFSGVLASKWVVDPAVRAELSDFLTVLDHTPDGDVRFMIMNPDGPGYRRLRDLQGDQVSAEHLPILAQFAAEHSSFQVKVFDHLPLFRIHVLDKDVVTFSFYRLDEESYLQGDRDWASPHVVLDPLSPWPLAEAFGTLFIEMWRSSSFLDSEKYT